MQRYNLLYIIPGSVEDDKAPETAAAVTGLLTKHGAQIVKDETLGKRRLAYAINKIRAGFYQDVEFDLAPESLGKINAELKLASAVLRHQIVKVQVQTAEQLAASAKLREKIAAKREAVEEQEVRGKLVEAETKRQADHAQAPSEPAPKVDKEELDKKLEAFLEGDITPDV